MADNEQKNSANLGELFLEFGAKGLGGLIKGLNSVSATFLLTKNAGQQMLQPLANMSKQAGQSVVALDKLNSVTGISVGQLQALKQWSTLNNIDFNDYIGQVHSLQNALARMSLGDASSIKGFAMLGLNPADFNPSKPLENMKKVENAMRRMYKQGGEGAKYQIALALQLLGLNEDLAYSYTRANKQIDKSLLLTGKQQEKLREQQEAWNSLKVASGSFFEKAISNTGWLTNGINNLAKAFKLLIHNMDEYNARKERGEVTTEEENFRNTRKIINNSSVIGGIGLGAISGARIGSVAGPYGAIGGTVLGALIGGVGAIGLNTGVNASSDYLIESYHKNKGLNKNIPQPKMLQNKNVLPNQISKNTTTNINYDITVKQDIKGNNAQEIADLSFNEFQNAIGTTIQVQAGSYMV